jgi:Tol biopolymer transport system component/tRNA A-37 threonylcarbamoyl transferase component Bud32
LSLSAGTKLGPYEVVAQIGAGGMGEVYKARDPRLERTVAIKVLPKHLSASPEVRQRFEREAKTVSQLSHPHICALYDVGREGETEYLVMEYLEGDTLSDRLGRGALPLEQTLKFGVEIADALDKAHRQGIVHRDLKPGNVMLTKTGVKLLDFGLAKAMAAPVQTSGATSLPTVMGTGENLTQEGTILGTFQYMAPEQLEGREADARTDVFAFGCVLYEMATGKKAFSGASQASLISSIMKEEPAPISAVQPMSPPVLDRVVKTCLAKDPEERWQSASDLRNELKWIAAGGSQSGVGAPAVAPARRRSWLPWAAALLLAAGGFAAGRWAHRAPAGSVARLSIELPPEMDLDRWSSPALSPDGSTLVFAATGADRKRQLWVRRMDGFALQPLAGTDDATSPFWSPDSHSIGFFAARKLKRVPAAGGPVQTICDAQDGRGGSWSVDDVIVFAPAPFMGLSKVPATGGAPVAVTRVESQGRTHRLPWFLPNGKHLIYLSGTQTSDEDKDTTIQALDLATGKSTLVARENSEGRFAEPGYLVFVREGNLLAQPFDPKGLKTTGPAVPIAEGVAFEAFRWVGKFTIADTGRLVYQSNEAFRKSRLTWFDLDGKPLGTVGEAANFFTVALSPDARRVVATVLGNKNLRPEIRLYDLERGVGSRFTFGAQGANFPAWSPDGRAIAYGDPGSGVRVKAADGSSESKLILSQKTNIWPLSWSADGKRMLLRIQDVKSGGVELWDLPLEGESKPRQLFPTDPDELQNGSISPDGKWLLYVSNETGRREVYVVPYPSLGEKRQVSTSGAVSGKWMGDHAILYEQPPDGRLFAVDVDTRGGGLSLGPPRSIFGGKPPPRGPFDATRDGKRLLYAVPVEDAASAQIRFVSDWRAELAKK